MHEQINMAIVVYNKTGTLFMNITDKLNIDFYLKDNFHKNRKLFRIFYMYLNEKNMNICDSNLKNNTLNFKLTYRW